MRRVRQCRCDDVRGRDSDVQLPDPQARREEGGRSRGRTRSKGAGQISEPTARAHAEQQHSRTSPNQHPSHSSSAAPSPLPALPHCPKTPSPLCLLLLRLLLRCCLLPLHCRGESPTPAVLTILISLLFARSPPHTTRSFLAAILSPSFFSASVSHILSLFPATMHSPSLTLFLGFLSFSLHARICLGGVCVRGRSVPARLSLSLFSSPLFHCIPTGKSVLTIKQPTNRGIKTTHTIKIKCNWQTLHSRSDQPYASTRACQLRIRDRLRSARKFKLIMRASRTI